MTGERTEQALARIEAALARIERAGTAAHDAFGDAARKHDALRMAVTETLGELDSLIGSARAGIAGQ